jgi:endonuclease G
MGALGALLFAGAAAVFGMKTGACSPDFWLEDKPPSREKPSPSGSAATSASGRAPSKKTPTKGPLAGPPAQSVHLELGTPADKDPSDDHLLIKPQYALSYNKTKNVPNWVSWNLNAGHFGDAPRFKGKFIADTSLPEGFYRVRHEDYVGSGYDRGHMVRSEERTRSPEDNKTTFLLTNILPQQHDLNAGPWLRLEEHCQDLAQKEKRELYIMAGGIFGKRPETIGEGVAVPDSCFKIVVVLEKGQGAADVDDATRVIAVVMPNTTGILSNDWGRYRTTVDEIERRTGYDFMPRLAESLQAALESRADTGPTD